MHTKMNYDPPSSVDLRALSTLRHELQLVEMRISESSQDKCQFFKDVKSYMEDRIQSIAARLP